MDHAPDDYVTTEPRPPGRRGPPGSVRVPEPRHGVSVWLPASVHDKLIKVAAHHDMSVSSVLRAIVILRLR